ncbi:putative ferric-chelate reductase 1 isoform X1, partial [Clarias magur]
MKHQVIILIYLGGSILHLVKCFSGGSFDPFPEICETMGVIHANYQPQSSNPPFKVDPENIFVAHSDVGKFFNVTVSSDSFERFRGFMLEARKPGNKKPQGFFSLTNTVLSRLQKCDGMNGKAVTQTNNSPKTIITVKWTTSESGQYYFRASFIQSYEIFWIASWSPEPSSTPAPTSTHIPSSTPAPTSTHIPSSTLAPTSTHIPSSTLAPSSTHDPFSTPAPTLTLISASSPGTGIKISQPRYLFESSLAMHLFSYLFLAELGPLLMKDDVCVCLKVTSFLSLVFSMAAFFLLLTDTKEVEHVILSALAASMNLCQTILIFFLCGPSHELRKIFIWVLKVVAFLNVCFTIAAIYVGLVKQWFTNAFIWPSILMGIYLACQLLSYPFFIYGKLKLRNQQQTASNNQICK